MASNPQTGFDESGKRVAIEQFPFEEIFERLDGRQPEAGERLANALHWLFDERAVAYFGPRLSIHLAALAWAAQAYPGRSLASLARELKVSRQYLNRLALKASAVYGFHNPRQRKRRRCQRRG